MKTKDFQSVKDARKAAIAQLEFYNKMMAEKVAKKESVSQQYIREKVAKDMQPFYEAFPFPQEAEKMTKPTKKKLFVVDTISTFRNRYVIEADELEHAFDEVTMIDSGNDADLFDPAEQEYMGETILDGREISKKDFKKLLEQMEEKKTGSHWMGEKLIRKIDYGRVR
jgi:hypothetical protein